MFCVTAAVIGVPVTALEQDLQALVDSEQQYLEELEAEEASAN